MMACVMGMVGLSVPPFAASSFTFLVDFAKRVTRDPWGLLTPMAVSNSLPWGLREKSLLMMEDSKYKPLVRTACRGGKDGGKP